MLRTIKKKIKTTFVVLDKKNKCLELYSGISGFDKSTSQVINETWHKLGLVIEIFNNLLFEKSMDKINAQHNLGVDKLNKLLVFTIETVFVFILKVYLV